MKVKVLESEDLLVGAVEGKRGKENSCTLNY